MSDELSDLELAREHLENWNARIRSVQETAQREVSRLQKHRDACLLNIQKMERGSVVSP